MSRFLVVATGDNHLSQHSARMSPQRLEQRRQRLRDAFAAAAGHALAHGAELFIVAGDLFDSPSPTNADLSAAARIFHDLQRAGIAVCAVGGNHDTPGSRTVHGGHGPLSPLSILSGVHYFGEPHLETVSLQLGGRTVTVGGLTPPPGQARIDPLSALLANPGAPVEIFITHGAIEGHSYSDSHEPVLLKASARQLPGLRLAVAGHVHRFAAERVGQSVLVSPGTTEWLNHGEVSGRAGFAAIVLGEGGVESVAHVELDPQPRRTLEIAADRLGDDPQEALEAAITDASSPELLLRVVLRGALPRSTFAALRLRELQRIGSERNFQFDLHSEGLRVADEPYRAARRGVRVAHRDEVIAAAAELRSQGLDEDDATVWDEARDDLLRRLQ